MPRESLHDFPRLDLADVNVVVAMAARDKAAVRAERQVERRARPCREVEPLSWQQEITFQIHVTLTTTLLIAYRLPELLVSEFEIGSGWQRRLVIVAMA